MMTEVYKQLLGLVVRAALMSLGTYLVTHHVMTAEQADGFTHDMFTHIMLAAPAIGALAWSAWGKVRGAKVLATALESPPGATLQDVKAKVKSGAGTPLAAALLAVAVAAGTSPACATGGGLKPPSQLTVQDVRTILVDAEWGVKQACTQTWLTPNVCNIIIPAIDTGVAGLDKDPAGAAHAGVQVLQGILAALPPDSRARPYLTYAVILLGGSVQ